MAIKHFLALDIPDTSCENVIKINDTSVYASLLAIDCLRLDITLPGTTQPIYMTLDSLGNTLLPYFVLNLSAIDLGIQPNNVSTLNSLPDGLYTIAYSVSPNATVNVSYYHLRVTKTMTKYYQELCKIQLAKCSPTFELLQRLNELRYIRMLIDSAKAKAEVRHSPIQAVDMLTNAIKLLDSLNSSCCVTCNC